MTLQLDLPFLQNDPITEIETYTDSEYSYKRLSSEKGIVFIYRLRGRQGDLNEYPI